MNINAKKAKRIRRVTGIVAWLFVLTIVTGSANASVVEEYLSADRVGDRALCDRLEVAMNDVDDNDAFQSYLAALFGQCKQRYIEECDAALVLKQQEIPLEKHLVSIQEHLRERIRSLENAESGSFLRLKQYLVQFALEERADDGVWRSLFLSLESQKGNLFINYLSAGVAEARDEAITALLEGRWDSGWIALRLVCCKLSAINELLKGRDPLEFLFEERVVLFQKGEGRRLPLVRFFIVQKIGEMLIVLLEEKALHEPDTAHSLLLYNVIKRLTGSLQRPYLLVDDLLAEQALYMAVMKEITPIAPSSAELAQSPHSTSYPKTRYTSSFEEVVQNLNAMLFDDFQPATPVSATSSERPW
ncbi:hypothetical protein JYU14_00555 [Simkania negevensis]|uniref:Secreted protein n=1 Tax=Simkania negevensis TaxID=83561 RepID=A0ABS3AQ09_9BACT|nr:hypothetical protein [Simkania negevensis]